MSGLYTHLRKQNPRLWRIWYRMCYRCQFPDKAQQYKGYKDVEVDEDWDYYTVGSKGFINFYDDMIQGYKEELELDRIDVFGHYTKSNLRWTTRKVNNNNKRWHHGEMAELHRIRKANGVARHTFYGRLYRGWDPMDAATLGPDKNTNYKNRSDRSV